MRFPSDSPLPDPFDGLVEGAPGRSPRSTTASAVRSSPPVEVVGVLTADALATDAFDGLDEEFLVALGALAGAALHTARLFETIEVLAEQRGMVVQELTRTARRARRADARRRARRWSACGSEIEAVASTEFPVLILGETGVGKELVARAIHDGSRRRDAPFIQVNCAALPEGVIESELFGHVRGAFTGAVANRAGKFELADGGTLFLDEIGELPLGAQAKLLRALQEGEVQRVGSDKPIRVDVRIVAATNRDLARRGRRRPVPRRPLLPARRVPARDSAAARAHAETSPSSPGFFLDRHRAQLGLPSVVLAPEAAAMLEACDWPGNVRELDHVIARAVLRAKMRTKTRQPIRIEAIDIDPDGALARRQPPRDARREAVARGQLPLRDALEELKRDAVAQHARRDRRQLGRGRAPARDGPRQPPSHGAAAPHFGALAKRANAARAQRPRSGCTESARNPRHARCCNGRA